MSREEKVMEDTYATQSVHYDNITKDAIKSGKSTDNELFGTSSHHFTDREKELQQKKPDGLLARKMKRMFGGAGNLSTHFLQGAKMGALVGASFGGLMGAYYAISYKSFYLMPAMALGSGASFGFFMGIGMVMRGSMDKKNDLEEDMYLIKEYHSDGSLHKSKTYEKYIYSGKE